MVDIHFDPMLHRYVVRLTLPVQRARDVAASGSLPGGLVADLLAATELAEQRNAAVRI